MISDQERREIAARLRTAALRGNGERVTDGELVDVIAYECGVEGADCFDDRLLGRLAGLIDRPTCENTSGYCDVFECSECHCNVEITREYRSEYGGTFSVPFIPSYCPNCGAEFDE